MNPNFNFNTAAAAGTAASELGTIVMFDAEARRSGVVPAFDLPRRSKFTCEDFDTLKPLSQAWRVKGLMPSTGVFIIGGPSMSGKSFLVLDILARVCLGRPVLGHKSNTCGVLYVAAEDANGARGRIDGLRGEVGPLGGRFAFVGQAPDLGSVDDIADLRATVEEKTAAMAGHGYRLGIVAIDTMSASIPGADENSAKDMSPVLAALQSLAQDMGLLVVLVAHTGKNEDRGLRGWSGLLGNADGVILLETPKADGVRVGKATKVKNGASGEEFAFTLRETIIGQDEDGDDITTLLVVEAAVPISNGPSKPLAGGALTLADALDDLIARRLTHPAPFVPGAPLGQRAVVVEEWKTRAGEMGLFDQDDTPTNRRQKWHQAKLKILDRGMVRIEGKWAILQ